ncbi:hypothetical protein FE257_006904 [Aspergillus nanangensis]|uniref:Xylanolytic transcriptional activator regulatory domain-containing protein n=1 Tax=Aspergillus nanangensis TaxID=2582783 RepID=A0AAD4GTQ5_ASPNN|nr:hypothetical protein FE257_006904 [Aspergillus nanangensis]
MPRESARGRLRSHEACLNCRLVGHISPREARANSSYGIGERRHAVRRRDRSVPIVSGWGSNVCTPPSEEVPVEGNLPSQAPRPERTQRDGSNSHSPEDPSSTISDPFPLGFDYGEANLQPSVSMITRGIDLYFQHCHRQPIWCFEREELEFQDRLSEELIYSILALTSRFTQENDQAQQHASTARTLVMLRVANGTVKLDAIESLCLLSYSSFIDGDVYLGRFHLGLAFQLCRSAALDDESAYFIDDPLMEQKKRVFWSLQSLEQTYGHQKSIMILQLDDPRTPDPESRRPPLPIDSVGCVSPTDIGIWTLALNFGWVWSKVRTYISDCARGKLMEPWRYDSMYAMIGSYLTEMENKMSPCHRYDSVKFYERTAEDLRVNRNYWASWLKLQFTYHSILTVLNHPFLYIVASQDNPNLAIPNAFWRRSSELVLLHATWVVRMIDMISEKKMRLIDPFFGHVAAIAATVHLYYCCAADPRLKQKSKTDFAKCRRFVKSFVAFSPACRALDRTLDKLMGIASGSSSMEYDWIPYKIHLSVPLMWDILQLNCTPQAQRMSTGALLHPSLIHSTVPEDSTESNASTLEIIVATSPEITVNTADGGTAAHMPPNRPKISSSPPSPGNIVLGDKVVAPADSLMFNTPWLWTDPSQFTDMESLDYPDSEAAMGNIDGFSTWWDFGNL